MPESTTLREKLEWRCFHCDEVFTTPGAARDHFGATPECEPGCVIDRVSIEVGGTRDRGRGLLMALRKAEARIHELVLENETLENDARLWHESEADRIRRIGNVQWWQELDSREGEKLVLEERINGLDERLGVLMRENDALKRQICDQKFASAHVALAEDARAKEAMTPTTLP